MLCTVCGRATSVRESRHVKSGNYMRRRRICDDVACGHRMTTFELVGETPRTIRTPMLVSRERFVDLFKMLGQEFIERLGLNEAFDIIRARPEPEPEPELSASPSIVEE